MTLGLFVAGCAAVAGAITAFFTLCYMALEMIAEAISTHD